MSRQAALMFSAADAGSVSLSSCPVNYRLASFSGSKEKRLVLIPSDIKCRYHDLRSRHLVTPRLDHGVELCWRYLMQGMPGA